MYSPCPTCRPNKTKIVFDMTKARDEAKQYAIVNEKTTAIYKKGKALSYIDAATAIEREYDVVEYVSKTA